MPPAITMYNFPMSPPCRAVRMTAKILAIDLKLVDLDLFNKEHKKQWFVNINPNCLVPTIDDKGFYLGESIAIMRYLIDQYAPDHALYPKDIKKRAIIDWLLDFNIATLFKALASYLEDVMFRGQTPKPERMDEFNQKVAILEEFLTRSPYVAGDHMTIADLSVITSLDFAEIVSNSVPLH
ncbi:glutathione S-transferase 1-like isoform X2 [Parasteatoda tepidariorum]|uniref:glutathione S-transferase 1-like isoform X2 n=1 Tax=Parasteatoda tepidariorum TaxID=114398 RepID=UPI001C7285CA|nr:glutathione S-transferase 1-like isoform X2 [Parasteatoda tepidariorum]